MGLTSFRGQSFAIPHSPADRHVLGYKHCTRRILGSLMERREFITLTGGAAAVGARPVREALLPDGAAGNSVQKEEQDFPLIIVNKPATGQQKAMAVGIAVLLLVAAAVIAPFASIQLGRVDAFIPVLQTALSIADFITAALLFAQYSIQPQTALLALAGGYMFCGLFAFLQNLAFSGGCAPPGFFPVGAEQPTW